MHPWYRSRTFYRLVLVAPVVTIVASIAPGHITERFSVSVEQHAAAMGSVQSLLGLLIGAAIYGPLVFACWDVGRENATARRMGYSLFVGLRDVVLLAFGRERAAAEPAGDLEPDSREPRDNPRAALMWAAPVAVLVPTLFAVAAPPLRTPLALAWLIGAGISMASSVYFRRRAIAYLLDEPSPWGFFSGLSRLDSSRYAEPGRVFVRRQIFSMFALMVWWLGVGILVLSHMSPTAKP
ncbi:MAG TPA: hypothetical protein VJO52_08310 [Gemmatimonadaceae bacterium]|nr:hypothetical protein [Gemmatimonadaceae bacterium]